MNNKEYNYDILICGGGPAGLTAAVYCARAELKAAVLEGTMTGGQAALTGKIENYPGFVSVSGFELCDKMREQAELLGVRIIYENAASFSLKGKIKTVTTETAAYTARAVILAMGVKPRRLGLPDETALTGRGVSYCATCDGAFYKNKTVVVAGGGNTAAEDALYLARIADQVHMVHRRDALRADRITAAKVTTDPKIIMHWDSAVTELIAEAADPALKTQAIKKLKGVAVKNLKTGLTQIIPADGLFIAIGQEPATGVLETGGKPVVRLDENGYIWANAHMRTSVPGVFAAGDIRNGVMKQVVTACADGAVAAKSAIHFLQRG